MSGLGWQDVAAALLACAAAGYLVWRRLRAKRRAPGSDALVSLKRGPTAKR